MLYDLSEGILQGLGGGSRFRSSKQGMFRGPGERLELEGTVIHHARQGREGLTPLVLGREEWEEHGNSESLPRGIPNGPEGAKPGEALQPPTRHSSCQLRAVAMAESLKDCADWASRATCMPLSKAMGSRPNEEVWKRSGETQEETRPCRL